MSYIAYDKLSIVYGNLFSIFKGGHRKLSPLNPCPSAFVHGIPRICNEIRLSEENEILNETNHLNHSEAKEKIWKVPAELVIAIFEFLSWKDIKSCRSAIRGWHVFHNVPWASFFWIDGEMGYLNPYLGDQDRPSGSNSWKLLFKLCMKLERENNFQEIRNRCQRLVENSLSWKFYWIDINYDIDRLVITNKTTAILLPYTYTPQVSKRYSIQLPTLCLCLWPQILPVNLSPMNHAVDLPRNVFTLAVIG